MKSRITIEVDFENANEPVIQILQNSSDDVRDNLIKQFLEGKGHLSRWLKIQFQGNRTDGGAAYTDVNKIYHISVIKPKDIPEEIKLMEAVLKEPAYNSIV